MTYLLGSDMGTLYEVKKDLGIPEPKGSYFPAIEAKRTVSGKDRWVGSPKAVWNWGFLSQAQRDTLRTYLTDSSGGIYICTRTNDSQDAFAYYYAIYHWPLGDENKDCYHRVPFEIEFTHLIQQEEPK